MIDYWKKRGVLTPLQDFMKSQSIEASFDNIQYVVSCNVTLENISSTLSKFLGGPCCFGQEGVPEQSVSNLSRELVSLLSKLRDIPRRNDWGNICESLTKIDIRLSKTIDQLESRSNAPMGFATNVRNPRLFLSGSVNLDYESGDYMVIR